MEVGSNFWINADVPLLDNDLGTPEQFGCIGSDYVWMSTGRSATRFVIKTILERNPAIAKRVLLPPFTCNTVIDPFIESNFHVDYYTISRSLLANSDELVAKALNANVSIVLFHRYFGFETIPDYFTLIKDLQENGLIVIEDCTQCLYSSFDKSLADYTVGSVRKWLGAPDGGFATCKDGFFHEKPSKYDKALEEAKVLASCNKFKYLFEGIGSKEEYLAQYRKAENILEEQRGWFTIGKVSALIQSNEDISFLKMRRRRNYHLLDLLLNGNSKIKPVFKGLNPEVVPLYFPIIVEDRSGLQKNLIRDSIYAPIVWPKMDGLTGVCESADYLYNHMLCIPIDQRYSNEDIERVACAINDF